MLWLKADTNNTTTEAFKALELDHCHDKRNNKNRSKCFCPNCILVMMERPLKQATQCFNTVLIISFTKGQHIFSLDKIVWISLASLNSCLIYIHRYIHIYIHTHLRISNIYMLHIYATYVKTLKNRYLSFHARPIVTWNFGELALKSKKTVKLFFLFFF